MVNGWLMEFFSVFSKFTYKWTTQTNLARLARPFRGRKHHFFPIIAVFQDFQTIQRLQNYLRGCPSISFNIATFLYIDSTTMSVWRPLFIKCIILDHKLQRMLNDSKIAQLNSERPLHQTAVGEYFKQHQSSVLSKNILTKYPRPSGIPLHSFKKFSHIWME